MRKRTRFWVGLVLLLLLVLGGVFTPALKRTAQLAGDAYGLTLIASMDEASALQRDKLLLTPDMAVWLLKHFDWPYRGCRGVSRSMNLCDQSLISWTGAMLDMYEGAAGARSYVLLQHFIQRGEPLDQLYHGLAPVHDAILFRNATYLEMLLSGGADPYIQIARPGHLYDGMDAFAFVSLLDERTPADYSAIHALLDLYR